MDAGTRLADIAGLFHLDAVYVFGSRARDVLAFARGQATLAASASDIDIGVLPEPNQHLDARQRVDLVLVFEASAANNSRGTSRLQPGSTAGH